MNDNFEPLRYNIFPKMLFKSDNDNFNQGLNVFIASNTHGRVNPFNNFNKKNTFNGIVTMTARCKWL